MKKTGVLFIATLLLLTLPAVAFGFTSPSVSEGNGEVSAMFVSDDAGIQIGATYGINDDLGVLLQVGEHDYTKLAIMYQLNPNLAVEGGILSSDVFIGVTGATALNKQLLGVGELDLRLADKEFAVDYQAGVEYAFKKNFDIRGGVFGSTAWDGILFGLGVGYHF